MPDVSTHPSAKALALFGLGKLREAQAAAVAAHLETCADCRQAVAELPPDSFMVKVREAQPGDGSVLTSPSARPAASPSLMGKPAAPAAPPADVPPELANHPKFRIVRELGRGGMGKVYEAVQTFMDRRVAIKVMNPALLDNPDALARFHTEVKAAAKLDHPNIVRAHDAEPAGSLHLLVMELVEGHTLAQVVERRGPLPVSSACLCVQQAARGLQHAFEQGMVHRDVKPHNLMLTPRGVKVLDFGLARMRSERARGPGLTQMDTFMGTPEYVAPEQATDARSADTRADIYSLGCTLYFLLTGRPPFEGRGPTELAMAHLYGEPVPLHKVRPDVPAELSAVVGRMLAKDPAQRYQTPVEVAQALAPFIMAGGQAGTAAAAPLPPPVRAAGTGTVVGKDTSRVEKAGQKASPPPARETARANDKTSPFADLGDAPPKPVDRGQGAVRGARAKRRKRPGVLVLATVGALMLLAGIIVKVTTSDGSTLVVEVNEPNPDVFVNGDRIAVKWDGGGKRAEISRVPDSAKVDVKKDGFTVSGEKVEVKDGKRVLRVTLVPKWVPNPPVVPRKPPPLGPGQPPPPVVAAGKEGEKEQDENKKLPEAGQVDPPKPDAPDKKAAAIEKGIKYLKDCQQANGTWQYEHIGLTALCGLTLLECDVPANDPAIRKAAHAVRSAAVDTDHTYSIALSILFLDHLGEPVDVALIESLAVRLLAGQAAGGVWGYTCPKAPVQDRKRLSTLVDQSLGQDPAKGPKPRAGGERRTVQDLPRVIQLQLESVGRQRAARRRENVSTDNSNTQFAILGLWVARRHGMPVDPALLEAEQHFHRTANPGGGWGYPVLVDGKPAAQAQTKSTTTMTCAGLLGIGAAYAAWNDVHGKAKPQDPSKDKLIDNAVRLLGLWLDGMAKEQAGGKFYYYMWSLERVALAFDLDRFGNTDWYDWGSGILLANQGPDGGWNNGEYRGPVDTCFALLFLRRANMAEDMTRLLKVFKK
jgi:hypothetical protein